MAQYALLDSRNEVIRVIEGRDDGETDWEEFYSSETGFPCKRTDALTRGGAHMEGGVPFRKNYAGIGYTYDEELDAFIPPKPGEDWTINEETGLWDAPLSVLKQDKRAALALEYQSRIQSFSWDFGSPFGVLHLQLRDVTDQANWLTLQGKALVLIQAGQGNEAILPIRTEENITVPVTAQQAMVITDALSTFGGAMLAHRWSMQDAIMAAEDEESLDAIDVTVGWPA